MRLDIGDTVVLNVAKDNRDWGYNPGPDGQRGIVIELGTTTYGRIHNYGKEPGVYENRSWGRVKFFDSGEESDLISSCHLTTTEESRDHREGFERAKLSDLPETSIWEGDIIRLPGETRRDWTPIHPYLIKAPEDHWIVDGIHWSWETNENGYSMNFSTNIGIGAHMMNSAFRTENTELIRRGRVWKWYHDEPINWVSLEDEASFHHLLCLTEEIRNPANKLYCWTKDECLAAIRDNIAHGMSVGNGLFGGGVQPSAVRFKDEDLGERVRLATLAGFHST